MTSLNDKLSKITSAQPSGWREKAVERRESREWLKRAASIGVKVLQALRRQGITQRELAERMGVSAQQVNKIVKGSENLTLETLVKLEKALSVQLLQDHHQEHITKLATIQLKAWAKSRAAGGYFVMSHQGSYANITTIRINPSGSDLEYVAGVYPVTGKETWTKYAQELS